jgi:hypothetical protein
MKKILLVAMLLTSTLAFSQVEKGDFNATANVAFSSQKFKDLDDPVNLTNITLRGGYYFTDHIEGGLSVSLTSMSILGEKQSSVGYGPYGVYNFLTADAKLLPYVGANFFHLDMDQEGVDPINQIGAFGGAKYFLTEAVNVDASLNYTTWLGDIEGSSLLFNIGIGINFGKLK